MEIPLTYEAEYLLLMMYKAYIDRTGNGSSQSNASKFGSAEEVRTLINPNWKVEDVATWLGELSSYDLVATANGDNTVYYSSLSRSGISYIEHRFERKFNKVLSRIVEIKKILGL